MKNKTDYESLKKVELFREYMLIKTEPLKFLFDGVGTLSVFAELDGRMIEFDVQVKHPTEVKRPWDCKFGNFELNKYFRTDKGANGEKYKTLGLMLSAIAKTMKKELSAEAKYYKLELNPSRRKE